VAKRVRSSTVNVEIHRSQFPERLEAELAECLRARRVNHKFHYESHKQVQRWLALHEAHSPARIDSGVERIYGEAFQSVAGGLSAHSRLHVVSLGSGGGRKDAAFLKLLADAGAEVSYTPVDVSVGLALTSREVASEHVSPGRIRPLVCDLLAAEDLADLLTERDQGHVRRAFLFFGMLPNFEPSEILGRLAGWVRDDDLLLCSANLAPGQVYEAGIERILPQYDNAATRSWLATLPNDLGLEVDPARIAFSIQSCEDEPTVRRVEATVELGQAACLSMGSEAVEFRAGETLRLFFSCRYTPLLLEEMMRIRGLGIGEQWISESGEEGVFRIERMQ